MFTKFEWVDTVTQIDNFCDLSDFILSSNWCDKNWKRMKIKQIFVDQVYNLYYYLKKQYGDGGW